MRVLIIKTSSMGDVIHTLPAITDAAAVFNDISFDWIVEPSFAEIPAWHPNVKNVFSAPVRRWRKSPIKTLLSSEWREFRKKIKAHQYDYIIDAQGLLKSAWLTRLAKGLRCGLDRHSARESLASVFYKKRVRVNPKQHAVTRVRELFAKTLNYPLTHTPANYGIDRSLLAKTDENYVVFLHGTTWTTKHWPESYWQQLATIAGQAGYGIKLLWGNDAEQQRAERIAKQTPLAEVMPKLNLAGVTDVLAGAKGIVAVDTGLGHMAAALAVPTLSLYGPTNAELTGTEGIGQQHFSADFSCSPCLQRECSFKGNSDVSPACFATVTPEQVWLQLEGIMGV